MKTTSQNQIISSELINRSHHQSESGQPETAAAQTTPQAERKDNRLPIDSEARKQNRTLPTPKVLTLLHQQLPAAYRLAEVVGKWIWVQFKEQPAAEIRQQLAQLGFHWNRERHRPEVHGNINWLTHGKPPSCAGEADAPQYHHCRTLSLGAPRGVGHHPSR